MVARTGTVILGHKVTLEVEVRQAEQQDRKNLGFDVYLVKQSCLTDPRLPAYLWTVT